MTSFPPFKKFSMYEQSNSVTSTNTKPMKTPTPEEVRQKKVQFIKAIGAAMAGQRGVSIERLNKIVEMFDKYVSEQNEIYYTERIENAGSELPSDEEIEKGMDLDSNCDENFVLGKKEMKQAASVVIAKVKHDLQSVIDHQSRSIINAQEKYESLRTLSDGVNYENVKIRDHIKILFEEIMKKDREIGELKKYKNMFENHRDSIKKTTNN